MAESETILVSLFAITLNITTYITVDLLVLYDAQCGGTVFRTVTPVILAVMYEEPQSPPRRQASCVIKAAAGADDTADALPSIRPPVSRKKGGLMLRACRCQRPIDEARRRPQRPPFGSCRSGQASTTAPPRTKTRPPVPSTINYRE